MPAHRRRKNRSEQLADTDLFGARTQHLGIRVDRSDPRSWLSEFPTCALLNQHQIAHVGICRARPPYRIVRDYQGGTYFLACLKGRGRILIDGRWESCGASMACLLPPRIMNAFYASRGEAWEFCWVRYQQPQQQRPLSTAGSPVLAKFDAGPLRASIEGLHAESENTASPALMHHWVELIQGYVMRFAQPLQDDNRLWQLWEMVSQNLARKWTLGELASACHLSTEHLRRLCRQQMGRSPMRQLTYLRMQQAGDLLATTNQKIEAIAAAVGYENPFVFSSTFKKWIGWRPSQFRASETRPG